MPILDLVYLCHCQVLIESCRSVSYLTKVEAPFLLSCWPFPCCLVIDLTKTCHWYNIDSVKVLYCFVNIELGCCFQAHH